MLQSLHVHNFALLEDARVDFTGGFNVFTGETGAGKSILIDAFSLVLGGRASAEYVRRGTEGLWVQAVFDVRGRQDIKSILTEQGIEAEDELFLKRRLSASGKSRALLNGVQVPLAVLRQLGTLLVDIHGQHENQALLKPDAPLRLTDSFGGSSLAAALRRYQELYRVYTAAAERLHSLQQDAGRRELLLDRCSWEINEITAAGLRAGEAEELEAEAALLQNSERILTAASRAHELLDEDEAVLAQLARVRDELRYAARYDGRLAALAEAADSAWISLDDCRTELGSYLSASDFNAERAEQLQQRLDLIYRLQKKYGGSVEAALAYLAQAQEKLAQLQDLAAALERAAGELEHARAELAAAAAVLTRERSRSAAALEEAVTVHIRDLAMPSGVFRIRLQQSEKFTPVGRDEARFWFSANLGEPVSELEKVASGGELSRLALAVKTVLMDKGRADVMVFDEIDTGVGGVTAQRMAEKLAAIASVGQVLCVTHLPQIAAFADNHIYIEKRSAGGRTATVLSALGHSARLRELARMAAGSSVSRAACESAAELLQAAEQVKSALQSGSKEV